MNVDDLGKAKLSPQFIEDLVAKSPYKYREDVVLERLREYIDGTYSQHYVCDNDIQTLDIWDALGSASTTCRDTAIKYLMRLGKKDIPEKEILKALHYLVLLWHFNNKEQNK